MEDDYDKIGPNCFAAHRMRMPSTHDYGRGWGLEKEQAQRLPGCTIRPNKRQKGGVCNCPGGCTRQPSSQNRWPCIVCHHMCCAECIGRTGRLCHICANKDYPIPRPFNGEKCECPGCEQSSVQIARTCQRCHRKICPWCSLHNRCCACRDRRCTTANWEDFWEVHADEHGQREAGTQHQANTEEQSTTNPHGEAGVS